MNNERQRKITKLASNVQAMSYELERMLHNMNDILQEWYDGDNIPEQQTEPYDYPNPACNTLLEARDCINEIKDIIEDAQSLLVASLMQSRDR